MTTPQRADLLSQVAIDGNKDWGGYRIQNIATPAAGSDALSQGLVNPYYSDYGLNWKDLGVITSSNILSTAYLGNGIAILGDGDGHVYRSTDYGAAWTDLGVISTWGINTMAYLGNGIAIFGDHARHVFRSTDYGATWTDLGVIAHSNIFSTAYLGNGIVIMGDSGTSEHTYNDGHVYRSTDYGATWIDLGVIATYAIYAMAYLGNGIAILGDGYGHVFRSTDYGAAWTDLGVIGADPNEQINAMAYLGNGIAILGGYLGNIYRSTDYGATWADLGVITFAIFTMAYLGNGIAIFGDYTDHVFRSTDYGAAWTDLGVIALGAIYGMAYLGNGIAIMGDEWGYVYRSTSAFEPDNFFSPYQFDLSLQFGCLGIITPNGTSYLAPGNGATQLNEIKIPVTRPGLLNTLSICQRVASGAAGITGIYTVRVNGVDTAITCTLDNAAAGSDVAHSKLVAAGDLVSVSLVSNSLLDTSADVTATVRLT